MNPVNISLGATLRSARRTFGWSQERFAEIAGLDRSYVGEIERGKVSPSLMTLEKLSTALGMKVSSLIQLSKQR